MRLTQIVTSLAFSGFTAGVDGGRAYDAASSEQASQDLQSGARSIPA
jgi:hypothetical protein